MTYRFAVSYERLCRVDFFKSKGKHMEKLYFIVGIFFCALVYCKFSNQASKNVHIQDGSEQSKIVLNLSVNGLEKYKALKSRVHLVVVIPQDFVSIIPIEQAMKANMLEFIPKTDKSVDVWSEIITVQKFIDRSIVASELTNSIQQNIEKLAQEVMILESTKQEHSNYCESFFMMTYVHRGRKEILAGKYFSGPYDCPGVQYTIIITDTMTEEKAIDKIKKFMNENVNIIKF